VTREDVKNVFGRIGPDAGAKERMLENILNHSEKDRKKTGLSFNFMKAAPAFALVLVLAAGILTFSLRDGKGGGQVDAPAGREDMVAPLPSQFSIDGRNYILMSDYAAEFGFPGTIEDEDIGPRIAAIEESTDKSLVGCEVFRYLPAGCDAVVAVKRDGEFVLFRFFTFKSYENNQDEDAIEYLKLYGIEGPEDISRIQFIAYAGESGPEIRGEISDIDEIAVFYSYYSALKNSSDRYFEKLFGYTPAGRENAGTEAASPAGAEGGDAPVSKTVEPMPPHYGAASGNAASGKAYAGYEEADGSNGASQSVTNAGGTSPASVAPSQGSGALDNPVNIRIYNRNGVYFDSFYYKNIGFISRYEITAEFAAFLEKYI